MELKYILNKPFELKYELYQSVGSSKEFINNLYKVVYALNSVSSIPFKSPKISKVTH